MSADRRSRPRLKEDPLVTSLVPDAAAPPDVRVLVGFLGKSPRPGAWRLYLTPALTDYMELEEDDVVHHESVDRQERGLGGTVLWVRRGANLRRTRTVTREAQADFLQGRVTGALLQRCRPDLAGARGRGMHVMNLASAFFGTCSDWEFDCVVLAAASQANCDPLVSWSADC